MTEVVPRFSASGSQGRARGWRSAAAAEARGSYDVPQGVRGGTQASTDGAQRAPFALGDDVERATRVLRIDLATAAASTFCLSADQPPPPASSAQTARPWSRNGVEHGEGGAESTARSSDSGAR